jgi:threonine/homoserine/homoserine lactone efflux protein
MSTFVATVFAGADVGFSIAAPIGPTSMLCIQRTLVTGLAAGVATGLGIATVHLAYGIVAITRGTTIGQAWLGSTTASLASGIILLGFAVRILRRAIIMAEGVEQPRTLVSSYCGAIAFGFLNPITPLLFAAASLPTLLAREPTALTPALVLDVFAGSLVWWSALSGGVSLLRTRLTSRVLNYLNKGAAMVLATLAINVILRPYGLSN